ncbi:MAG TPA: alpha/beta fold hydrolase, partial [Jiangellaceae bacterium]|nr:alpha/beta fold hydrolase [Jiangellaceae bacterium]
DVTLTTSDALDLGAWFVPATGDRREVTVLVANGNGGNRAGRAPLAMELRSAGFDVLLFDYRGYGGNPGSPTEDALIRDARAARAHLVQERGVDPERLVYFGESLGSGVVSVLAVDHPPAGLLLRSPFVDLPAMAAVHYPLVPARLLLWDRFPVAQNVAQADVPTTVVYGTADTIVPPEQSRSVADAAAGSVDVVEIDGAGHNDAVMFDGRDVIAAVEELADRAVGPS